MAWVPLMPMKLTLAAVLLFAAAVLWVLAGRKEPHPMPGAAWLFALVPLAYLVSWGFSIDQAVGVVGAGIDTDTLLMTSLLAASGMLGAALFRTEHGASALARTAFWAIAAAALFQIVVLVVGLPGPFADRTVNLAGKWDDLGVLVLLLASLSLVNLQFAHLSKRMRGVMWAAGVVALCLLAMINFSTVWALLLAVALGVGFITFVATRRVPWVPVAVGAIAAAFFFFGAPINAALSSVIPVTSLEVRPSLQTTFDIVTQTHGASVKSTALGMGPNTFGLMWLAYKPLSVNQSQFWSLDFSVGYSTLLTVFGATGFVGLIAWLVPLVAVLYLLWRSRATAENRLAAWSLGLGAMLLWAVLVFYVPSPDLILLAFVFAGGAVGLLATHGRWGSSRAAQLVAMTALVVALAWVGCASARRAVAESYANLASQSLSASDLAAAQSYLAQSLKAETMPENLRLAVAIGGTRLGQIAAQPATAASQQAFTDTLKQTFEYGTQAITMDPLDYRSYLSVGQVYDFLAQNQVKGAYDNAKAAYQAAAARNPLNPTIPLLIAQLEARSGTAQGLQGALKQALTLKPDYTDAILFVAQIDIARKDIASAINDTKVAAQTAPGVASIWLQLGLLYYADKDNKSAIPALEQALKVQPDYANAQYYLGLAYAGVGRTKDAITQFARLNETNPGNAQVQSILGNLQTGKEPFASSTPATTKK
jgi:tetratricopeptide (TPR) repeat protein